ncbi:MAG: hypothetical protein QNJ58_27075 [Desulfobacterales bacterium]|nr:hypothetical protein [Desulfobacterales bacterium]
MIDEKDPGRKSVNDDDSDDEVIIDLTDEVNVKPEDENRVLNLTDDMADEPPEVTQTEDSPYPESDEFLTFDDTDDLQSQLEGISKKESVQALDEDHEEDQIIAAAIDESLEADTERERKSGELFDSEASADDKLLIIDDAPEEEIDVTPRADDGSSVDSRQPQDAFELEEEIELEYDVDDDEEIFLDLERSEDTEDFVNVVLDRSTSSDPSDDDHEPSQYLELEDEDLDDIVLPQYEREEESETLATPDETGELVDGEELPDIEAISDLDFEDIDGTDDSRELDTGELFSSDDILAGVGQTAGPVDADEAEFKPDTLGLDEIEKFPGLTDPGEVDQEMVSLTDDDDLVFEDETDSLDLEEGLDPDIDDDVIPLDGFNGAFDDQEEEIIEITEFDQHYPVEGDTLLRQTGILDPSSTEEDDFLELIDIEEDILSADQEVVEFGEPPIAGPGESVNRLVEAELEEAESRSTDLESIFNDDLEDRLLEEGVSETDPDVSLEYKDDFRQEEGFDLDEEKAEPEAGSPDEDAEIPLSTEALLAETEDLDFNIDPESISQQVDQLDTFLTEDQAGEPEKALFPSDYPEAENAEGATTDEAISGGDMEASMAIPAGSIDTARFPDESSSEEIAPGDAPAGIDSDEFPSVPVGQIDAAIERVINEKFAGKIEEIIYEVIEKAVAKEISRLKSAILGNNEPE